MTAWSPTQRISFLQGKWESASRHASQLISR